jgi:hypothetical protein
MKSKKIAMVVDIVNKDRSKTGKNILQNIGDMDSIDLTTVASLKCISKLDLIELFEKCDSQVVKDVIQENADLGDQISKLECENTKLQSRSINEAYLSGFIKGFRLREGVATEVIKTMEGMEVSENDDE